MRNGSDSFKTEISRRRKKFAALLIGIAVGLMPTVTVMAQNIETAGTFPSTDVKTISPGEEVSYKLYDKTLDRDGSGNMVVLYYPSQEDYDNGHYSGFDFKESNTSGQTLTVQVGDAGIAELDYWKPYVAHEKYEYVNNQLNYKGENDYTDNVNWTCVYKLVAVKKYKVTFDPNGAPGQPVVKETSNRKVSSFPEFTYEGYTFEGFFTKAEGGDEVTESTEFSQDTTVYAHWKKGKEKEKEKKKSSSSSSESHDVKPVVFNPYALNAHYYVNNVIDYKAILGRVEQGPAATAAFKAALPKGWNMAFSFSMSYDGKNEYSLKNGVIKLYVPAAYQKDGRQYAIMALDKNGAVKIIYDADKIAQLVTASPNVEGYAYELIYKD